MEIKNKNIARGNRKDVKSLASSNLVYGKVPPQAKDLEEAILGLIQLNAGAMDEISTILSSESFYLDKHQRIFSAALALANRNQQIDSLSLVAELKTREELELVGGPYEVVKLTNSVSSGANLVNWARIVQQKFIQREMIRICGDIIVDAYEDSTDAFDLLDHAEENLLSIGTKHMHGDTVSIDKVVMKAMGRIETFRLQESPITGVPSGLPTLDRATRGWQTGLIVMAARPSVGKSAVALALAKAASYNSIRSVPVAVWSLEMEDVQNVLRMLSSESKVVLNSIQTGRLDDEQMKKLYAAGETLSQRKIYFDDSPGTNIISFRAKARRLKKKHNIGLIILDYLQLLGGDGEKGNREQEISRISRALKNLSRELQIPIIALSQMSRAIESRKGKDRKPQMSDIRESGAIEQDADVVIMLWGPEDDEIEQNGDLKNRRYARIAKQRDGVLLTIDLEFDTRTQTITEYEPPKLIPKELPTDQGQKWKPITPDLFENTD